MMAKVINALNIALFPAVVIVLICAIYLSINEVVGLLQAMMTHKWELIIFAIGVLLGRISKEG